MNSSIDKFNRKRDQWKKGSVTSKTKEWNSYSQKIKKNDH